MQLSEVQPEFLKAQLRDSGLIEASRLGDGRLLLRAAAALPWTGGAHSGDTAEWVDVCVAPRGEGLSFRIEHPDSSEVMHPNWDGDGYWRLPAAEAYRLTDGQSLAELLRQMLGSLKFRANCYTLDVPVNRNAVSWCYTHGKLTMQILRATRPTQTSTQTTRASTQTTEASALSTRNVRPTIAFRQRMDDEETLTVFEE